MKDKLQTYAKLHDEIDNLCHIIMDYYFQFPLLAKSMHNSDYYDSFRVEDNKLYIICYDLYHENRMSIIIPLDKMDNWKEYIQRLEAKKQEEKQRKLSEYEDKEKEKRRKLYNQLKQEFESK